MIEFVIFVSIGSSFRLWSTAIVAETEKSPTSFFTSRDLFSPTAHWPRSLSGIIYPRNFRDKGALSRGLDSRTAPTCGVVLAPHEQFRHVLLQCRDRALELLLLVCSENAGRRNFDCGIVSRRLADRCNKSLKNGCHRNHAPLAILKIPPHYCGWQPRNS